MTSTFHRRCCCCQFLSSALFGSLLLGKGVCVCVRERERERERGRVNANLKVQISPFSLINGAGVTLDSMPERQKIIKNN